MTRIILAGGPPYCPLCDKQMREVWNQDGQFYVCTREFCNISLRANDPCIKKWKSITHPPCQFCHKPMKVFFRMDGLLIVQCRDKSHRFYQVAKGDPRALPPVG